MKPLTPGAQQALREYRRLHGVPPAVRARLLAQLERPLPDTQTPSNASSRPGRGLRLLRWGGPLAVLVVGLGLTLRHGAPSPRDAPRAEAAATLALVPPAAAPSAPVPASLPAPPTKRAHDERGPQRAVPRRALKRSSSVPEIARASAHPLADPTPPTATATQLPEGPRPLEPSAASEPASQVQRGWEGTSSSAPERQRAPEAPPPALSLDDEVMLLRRVSEHLAHGDPMRAMSALYEHARLFPNGKLVVMRKAARVRALCELGKPDEAEREAARFLAAHGDSPYAAQVRGGCQR